MYQLFNIFDNENVINIVTMIKQALPFGNLKKAKVLVIGHDPRLQNSDTIANYCFFANYFFKPIPKSSSEKAKYNLARAVFSYIGHLTSYKYTAGQIYITNLCNYSLPHAPKNKTVLIPENIAEEGCQDIQSITARTDLDVILPMSQQVNYWLQYFGFYKSTDKYLADSKPRQKGLESEYYEPKGKAPFLQVCGNKYFHNEIPLFPILHVKQYPLKGHIKTNYKPLLENCINILKK